MFRPVAIISCCIKVECGIHFTFNGSSKLFFLLVGLLRPQKKKKKKNFIEDTPNHQQFLYVKRFLNRHFLVFLTKRVEYSNPSSAN